MMYRWMALSLGLGLLLVSQGAAAQVRSGIPVETLTPPGTQLSEVLLNPVEGQPVRLAFSDGEARTWMLDVLVAQSREGALAALSQYGESVAGEWEPLEGLGDSAFGGRAHLGFSRDNIFIALHSFRGEDAFGWARELDTRIRALPLGSASADSGLIQLPRLQAGDAPRILRTPAEVLELLIIPSNSNHARRVRDGWMISTERDSDSGFELRWVDRRLRQP